MKWSYSLDELPETAQKIIALSSYKIILFNGEMGMGKTTLIKEICRQLNVNDIVNSPTFSLVNEYLTENGETLYHFDFYRIEDEEEALDMGIEEYLYSNNWCLLEWSEKVKNLLPLETVNIHITKTAENERTIELTNYE